MPRLPRRAGSHFCRKPDNAISQHVPGFAQVVALGLTKSRIGCLASSQRFTRPRSGCSLSAPLPDAADVTPRSVVPVALGGMRAAAQRILTRYNGGQGSPEPPPVQPGPAPDQAPPAPLATPPGPLIAHAPPLLPLSPAIAGGGSFALLSPAIAGGGSFALMTLHGAGS